MSRTTLEEDKRGLTVELSPSAWSTSHGMLVLYVVAGILLLLISTALLVVYRLVLLYDEENVVVLLSTNTWQRLGETLSYVLLYVGIFTLIFYLYIFGITTYLASRNSNNLLINEKLSSWSTIIPITIMYISVALGFTGIIEVPIVIMGGIIFIVPLGMFTNSRILRNYLIIGTFDFTTHQLTCRSDVISLPRLNFTTTAEITANDNNAYHFFVTETSQASNSIMSVFSSSPVRGLSEEEFNNYQGQKTYVSFAVRVVDSSIKSGDTIADDSQSIPLGIFSSPIEVAEFVAKLEDHIDLQYVDVGIGKS